MNPTFRVLPILRVYRLSRVSFKGNTFNFPNTDSYSKYIQNSGKRDITDRKKAVKKFLDSTRK